MNQDNLYNFLNSTFLDNPVKTWLLSIGILLLTGLLRNIFSEQLSRLIIKLIRRQTLRQMELIDFIRQMQGPLEAIILVTVFYLSTSLLTLPHQFVEWFSIFGDIRKLISFIYKSTYFTLFTWSALRISTFSLNVLKRNQEETETGPRFSAQLIEFLGDLIRFVLIGFAILIYIGLIFGKDIGTIIGGLGIGGLAVAFAAKETIENLLASFIIFIDKPCEIGDLIEIDGIRGHVEAIGFRSTRIRTMEKTYVSLPNKKLVDGALNNLTKRTFFRARFTVGMRNETKVSDIEGLIAVTRTFIGQQELVDPDYYVYIHEIHDNGIYILVLFLVETTDWGVFLEVNHRVNSFIVEEMNRRGIAFADIISNLPDKRR